MVLGVVTTHRRHGITSRASRSGTIQPTTRPLLSRLLRAAGLAHLRPDAGAMVTFGAALPAICALRLHKHLA